MQDASIVLTEVIVEVESAAEPDKVSVEVDTGQEEPEETADVTVDVTGDTDD